MADANNFALLDRTAIYRAYLRRLKYNSQDSAIEDKQLELQSEELINQSLKISRRFCNWVEGVGSEDSECNIKTNEVVNLFAIGQEKARVALLETQSQDSGLNQLTLTADESI